jgi:predicted nucleic acid-binding protein
VIILDTNVLSELMQQAPNQQVLGWLDRQPPESVWITSITLLEGRTGLAFLPPGRRRKLLESRFEQLVEKELDARVLPFDADAATQAAALAGARKRVGRIRDIRDTQIAGIVLARRANLATRNVKHFEDLVARVINPWSA